MANDGLWRISGLHGYALRDGKPLADVTEVTATIDINRIEVPLVGTTKQGYKPGRETREGTLRFQKIDSSWELEIYSFLTQGLAERRAARDAGTAKPRTFTLQVKYDDPDALGVETWELSGCQLWRLPLGFSIGDDIVDRELPFTFEEEKPVSWFTLTGTGTAVTQKTPGNSAVPSADFRGGPVKT